MSTTEKVVNKEVRTVRAASQRLGRFNNENTVRGFAFTIDEPAKLGGTDTGPTPMEYVLGSFNGCLLIVIEMVVNELGVKVRNLTAESTGTVDRRGLFGTADVSPHFQEVRNTILLETDEPIENIELFKEQVLRRCPAYNLFKDARIAVQLDWTIKGGAETI